MVSDPRGAYMRYDVRDIETDRLLDTGISADTVEKLYGTNPNVRTIPCD